MAVDYGTVPANVQDYLKRAGDNSTGGYTSDRRLYLTDAGTVVEEGDENALYLLVGEGATIPQSLADDLGVKADKKKARKASDIEAEAAAAKGSTAPTQDDPATLNTADTAPTGDDHLADLALTDAQKSAIAAGGFDTREKIQGASDDELRAIPGIGDASLAKIRDLYPAT